MSIVIIVSLYKKHTNTQKKKKKKKKTKTKTKIKRPCFVIWMSHSIASI